MSTRPEVKRVLDRRLVPALKRLSLKQLIRVEAHTRAWGLFPQWAGYANKEKG